MSTTDLPTDEPNNLPSPSDWKIGELYQRSWELIKKQKILWVFGMAVAGLGGGGGFNYNINLDQLDSIKEIFNKQQPPDPETSSNVISQVLGTATSNLEPLSGQLFSMVPAYFYGILALEVVLLAGLTIVISYIGSAWSDASLIHSIQVGLDNKNVSIRESSEKAFSNIKPLIGLALYISLISFAVLLVGVIIGVVGFVINSVVGGILVFLLVIVGIIYFLMLTITSIWAQRLVVLGQQQAWTSFTRGFKITQRKFWSSLLLGIVNSIASVIVIGIPIAMMAGLFAGGIFGINSNKAVGVILLVLGGFFALAFIIGYLLLVGIITAFKASVWTIAYNNIRGKYDQ